MFTPVGRRLALLNAAVVTLVIAIVGAGTYILLRQSLDREADSALADRVRGAEVQWAPLFAGEQPLPPPASPPPVSATAEAGGDEEAGEGQHEEAGEALEVETVDEEVRELLDSGDTLLYAFDREGGLLASGRDLNVPRLPDPAGVAASLAGKRDTRALLIAGATVRVYTAPVRRDDQIVGAIQAARGQAEHEAELRLVGIGSLIGVALGIVVAVPAGLFLARRAMRPIDAAFAQQRAFVADASHELRTPLTLIRANAELIQRLPDVPSSVRAELDDVVVEVDRMNRLTDDLLLLARVEGDALPLRRQPLDLGATVREAAESLADPAAAAGLALTLDTPAGIDVGADADRVRQVVRIVLDNAIAYTPRGGSVDVSVSRGRGRGLVTVRDSGVGIAPADQRRVFDRFYRADRARARASGGTGLGLAIARAIVQAHGGEIGLTSEPGRGTTVWFGLPLASGH